MNNASKYGTTFFLMQFIVVNPILADPYHSVPGASESYYSCFSAACKVTRSVSNCQAAELASQNARLNRIYVNLMEIMPLRERQKLRHDQNDWRGRRDLSCRGGVASRKRSTQLGWVGQDCNIANTAERSSYLERFFTRLSHKATSVAGTL